MNREPRDTFGLTDLLMLLREDEVAARWDKSLRTMQRWRYARVGPAYIRIGGTVFYRLGDVLAFEDSARHDPDASA